jgi:hypothetical protein
VTLAERRIEVQAAAAAGDQVALVNQLLIGEQYRVAGDPEAAGEGTR